MASATLPADKAEGNPSSVHVGARFGRWTVMERALDRRRRTWWLCRCDCGTERLIYPGKLRIGESTSCGCWQAELITTHGGTYTPEYSVWLAMRGRCLCETNPSYPNYGGRGIKICQRWIDSFQNFYEDMGPRPNLEYSIERTNNNGDYEPSNCIWLHNSRQSRNRRYVRLLTAFGRMQTHAEWAREIGISESSFFYRIKKGLPPEEAVSRPPKKCKR